MGLGLFFAVARPIYVSNSHIKFGWISLNGLGGDSITDGRTDVGDYYIKKRGDYKFIIAIFIRVAIIIEPWHEISNNLKF